jgi:hypothetical protein
MDTEKTGYAPKVTENMRGEGIEKKMLQVIQKSRE